MKSQVCGSIRFASMCADKKGISRVAILICFIISNLQTLMIILRNSYSFLENDAIIVSPIVQSLISLSTSTGYIPQYNLNDLTLGTASLLIYTLHIGSLAAYLRYRIHIKRPISTLLLRYWSFLCYLPSVSLLHSYSYFQSRSNKYYMFSRYLQCRLNCIDRDIRCDTYS